MMISFLAAFRTFRPSRFRNFLQVYNFPVVFSLARKISQNSSLQGCPQTSPHSWAPLRLGCLGGLWAHQHSPRSQQSGEMPQKWKKAVGQNYFGGEGKNSSEKQLIWKNQIDREGGEFGGLKASGQEG